MQMDLLYSRKLGGVEEEMESKDVLVLNLKNELYELRQLEKQYINLNSNVQNLEGKYRLLLEERERNGRDQQLKAAIDSSTVQELRVELEALNSKADIVNSETDEGIRTNNALKKMVDVKNKEIDQLRKENAMMISRNQKRKAEIQGKFAHSKGMKQDKNRLEDMVLLTRQQLDQSVLKGKQVEREIKNKQNQNTRLEKRVYAAARAEEIVNQNLKVKSQQLRRQTTRLVSLDGVFDQMLQELKQLQQIGGKRKGELQINKGSYQQQLRKSKELSLRLTRVQNQLRGRQKEINEMIKKRNEEVVTHQKVTEHNRMVNIRLDKNLEIVYQYQWINKDLISEIRTYCQVGEKVREVLNRKGRIQELILKVEKRVKASSSCLNHILR